MKILCQLNHADIGGVGQNLTSQLIIKEENRMTNLF
jgi:hypothetical protein